MADIFAPGASISSTYLDGLYASISGTSQAAPHISGIVALAQDLSMEMTGGTKLPVATLRNLIVNTGDTIFDGDDENDNVTNTNASYKRVDVPALMNGIIAHYQTATSGNDTLWGWRGNDTISGLAGTDIIAGNDGNDTLNGNDGNDTLIAQNGADTMTGGAGNDALDGGAGTDIAVFSNTIANAHVRTYKHADGRLFTQVNDTSGVNGTDQIVAVEQLQFSNGTRHVAGAQLNRISNVDGDRYDDVLFYNETTGQILAAKSNAGAFNGTWMTVATNGFWRVIDAGDIDQNGYADVFVQQQSNGQLYAAMQNAGGFANWLTIGSALGSGFNLVGAADVNGDASWDAIVQVVSGPGTGAIQYANMANGVFSGWVNVGNVAGWTAIGAGDVNRDGFADIVIQNDSNGNILYGSMANGTFAGSWTAVNTAPIPGVAARAVGDVSGDGFADIIVQDVADGEIRYANMAGGSFQGWGAAGSPLTSSYEVKSLADVDNDGTMDIIVQDTAPAANGYTIYADMNAGSFNTWGLVTNNINADWELV